MFLPAENVILAYQPTNPWAQKSQTSSALMG
jgi:hypothetical protein